MRLWSPRLPASCPWLKDPDSGSLIGRPLYFLNGGSLIYDKTSISWKWKPRVYATGKQDQVCADGCTAPLLGRTAQHRIDQCCWILQWTGGTNPRYWRVWQSMTNSLIQSSRVRFVSASTVWSTWSVTMSPFFKLTMYFIKNRSSMHIYIIPEDFTRLLI
jgi:hypothetical protein